MAARVRSRICAVAVALLATAPAGWAGPAATAATTAPEAPVAAATPTATTAVPTATTTVTGAGGQPIEPLAWVDEPQVWRFSTGDGVTVAVLDSGIDATHPELAGKVLAGEDFVDGSTDARTDPVGHGTAVASLIAGDDSGLAPDATILPVRVLDEDNRYRSAATVADGVVWAVHEGADVINLSLGGSGRSPALGAAIDLAMANDVVVVACTGNIRDGTDVEVWYPAREPGVLAVAGLTWSDGGPAHWSGSVAGPEAVLAAPAVLTAAAAGGGHREVRGTSFSAALVTAAAALVRGRWPEATAGEVVYRLVTTAEDLGEPGRDPVHGFGLVDPLAALTAGSPPVSVNPLDTKAREGQAGLGHAPSVAEDRGWIGALPGAGQRTGLAEPAGGAAEPRLDRTGRGFPALPVAATGTVLAALLLAGLAMARRARRDV